MSYTTYIKLCLKTLVGIKIKSATIDLIIKEIALNKFFNNDV